MRTIKGYKLFRLRKDGTIGPLFINASQRIEVGKWYEAEDHPTPGYQRRPGWHATLKPVAPHLCERNRVWCEVRLTGCSRFNRPQSQGGTWVLARKIKVVQVFKDGLPLELRREARRAALDIVKDRLTSIILGIEEDGKLYASWPTFGHNRHYTQLHELKELGRLMDDLGDVLGVSRSDAWSRILVQCSSSLDFPHEYTKDQHVINICNRLRGVAE